MKLLEDYIRAVCASRELGSEVAHRQDIPSRSARLAAIPSSLIPQLKSGLPKLNLAKLYIHQAEAIERVLAGEDVVVVTPTASGKTLCYNVPVLNACAENPQARALYLFPIQALEQDQLGAFRELAGACGLADRIEAEIYDGDTPGHKRRKIRNAPPSVIITNPDMLHVGMLAFHEKWEKFFSALLFYFFSVYFFNNGLCVICYACML